VLFVREVLALSFVGVVLTVGTVGGPGVLERSNAAVGVAGHQPVPGTGTYAWPVDGPVIRGFEPPDQPYGAGHRGIDIAAEPGTPVRSAEDGVVAFAGAIGGSLFVSVDHPDGIRTTYSWLSNEAVRRGDNVARGSILGTTGPGHPGVEPPHLHFGARMGTEYIDPMTLLEPRSVVGLIHLAPLLEEHI
jgi:murein DD-endopeptidase MepM/ murein hydrolase activator NlpD